MSRKSGIERFFARMPPWTEFLLPCRIAPYKIIKRLNSWTTYFLRRPVPEGCASKLLCTEYSCWAPANLVNSKSTVPLLNDIHFVEWTITNWWIGRAFKLISIRNSSNLRPCRFRHLPLVWTMPCPGKRLRYSGSIRPPKFNHDRRRHSHERCKLHELVY